VINNHDPVFCINLPGSGPLSLSAPRRASSASPRLPAPPAAVSDEGDGGGDAEGEEDGGEIGAD
jgi:hypothetical protein